MSVALEARWAARSNSLRLLIAEALGLASLLERSELFLNLIATLLDDQLSTQVSDLIFESSDALNLLLALGNLLEVLLLQLIYDRFLLAELVDDGLVLRAQFKIVG